MEGIVGVMSNCGGPLYKICITFVMHKLSHSSVHVPKHTKRTDLQTLSTLVAGMKGNVPLMQIYEDTIK